MDEIQRRKQVIETRQTDVTRWSDAKQLEPAWEARAVMAGDFVHAGTRVLDIGCGAMALERHLPFGCTYQPCDIVARDARTIVADLNTQGIPAAAVTAADLVVMLGVWEYIYKPEELFAAFARTGKPILCSYCDTGSTAHLDRRALGWVNDFALEEFLNIARAHGYRVALTKQVDALQYLVRLERQDAARAPQRKRVHVISYNNVGNFGDRLGYHLLNDVLPAHAELTWGTLRPFAPVPPDLDLLVVGIGNSLFGDLLDDQLLAATANAKATIGIFGTQYRPQLPAAKLAAFLDRLTHWYARYEEDVLLYGRGRDNVSHLGDWLINAFPIAVPFVDQSLHIGGGILKDLPLDRTIQHIQRHKRVFSERLHPLLCALTAAEEVSYIEQREMGDRNLASGKFRSMLVDIFGQAFPESIAWKVDRDRVAAYKAKVRSNTDAMRIRMAQLLA
ncbi:MAG: class I SAM-dependent methyltransferase [Alphaproteobacteria bacterium]|nr:class I SAM-dependent methyltransferase [Alphaproteobacteria bacterium]